jgi:hypothetical protein
MISNIEKINDHFKIPVSYNPAKKPLNVNIVSDLELTRTVDPSASCIYQYCFQPQTCFGKKILEQFAENYTTDTMFLKDSQTLIKRLTIPRGDIFVPDFDHIISLWDEIKNDNGFKDKYQYIDWPFWEFLNHNEVFLQVLSLYSLASPVISFLVPFVILLVPFFIIRVKGIELSFQGYLEVLKTVATNHAIGKLFTHFNEVKLDEKVYLLLSAAFYLFSIYQNVLTCIRFHENMKTIHSHLSDLKAYIAYTEESATNFLLYASPLSTMDSFNTVLRHHVDVLSGLKRQLQRITPYGRVPSLQKVTEFGHIHKVFYDLYDSKEYECAFLFSFGFHGYLDALSGLKHNVNIKNVTFASIKSKSGKAKKSKGKQTTAVFDGAFYPALVGQDPVRNSIRLDKNMILTGPNASGKTTILKTTLINVILTQQVGCGFYSSGTITPFSHIHCYLNIPDTSGRDSLFQAEARRCKDIIDAVLANPGESHLCVFDELYSGTNPEEAISSGTAFLQYLSKYRRVSCMLTTHFFELCKNLHGNRLFENFHMDTREDSTGEPGVFEYTYLMKPGMSQTRGGVKVLRDMNYPDEIIASTGA